MVDVTLDIKVSWWVKPFCAIVPHACYWASFIIGSKRAFAIVRPLAAFGAKYGMKAVVKTS